jgi:hypothetical protein
MPIIRLGVLTPAVTTGQQLISVASSHLVSVVVANTSSQATPLCKVDIWVQPQGANQESEYAYIASNLTIGVGQSFETFRFALNAQDAIYVKSSIAGTSFSAYGLLQADDVGPGDFPTVFRNKTSILNSFVKRVKEMNDEDRPIVLMKYNSLSSELKDLFESKYPNLTKKLKQK